MQSKMVNSEGKVHLRLLLVLARREDLAALGIEDAGIVLNDIVAIFQLVWPGRNEWHTAFYDAVPKELKPIPLKQHPFLAQIPLEGLNGGNFETWLAAQVEHFGEWFEVKAVEVEKE